MTPEQIVHAQMLRVTDALKDAGVICKDCGCTVDTYGDKCTAPLDVECLGFKAVEAAISKVARDSP